MLIVFKRVWGNIYLVTKMYCKRMTNYLINYPYFILATGIGTSHKTKSGEHGGWTIVFWVNELFFHNSGHFWMIQYSYSLLTAYRPGNLSRWTKKQISEKAMSNTLVFDWLWCGFFVMPKFFLHSLLTFLDFQLIDPCVIASYDRLFLNKILLYRNKWNKDTELSCCLPNTAMTISTIWSRF